MRSMNYGCTNPGNLVLCYSTFLTSYTDVLLKSHHSAADIQYYMCM